MVFGPVLHFGLLAHSSPVCVPGDHSPIHDPTTNRCFYYCCDGSLGSEIWTGDFLNWKPAPNRHPATSRFHTCSMHWPLRCMNSFEAFRRETVVSLGQNPDVGWVLLHDFETPFVGCWRVSVLNVPSPDAQRHYPVAALWASKSSLQPFSASRISSSTSARVIGRSSPVPWISMKPPSELITTFMSPSPPESSG